MKCAVCSAKIRDASHIAVDENGEIQFLCDDCYEKVRIFFEEVKNHGKIKS